MEERPALEQCLIEETPYVRRERKKERPRVTQYAVEWRKRNEREIKQQCLLIAN